MPLGKVILLLEIAVFEGLKGRIRLDGLKGALPSGRMVQIGCGLLHGVEHEAGGLVIDALVGECVDDLGERDLDGVHVLRKRKVDRLLGVEDAGAGHVESASAKLEVEVAVVAAAKSGRFAVETIFFEMVAGANVHRAS